MTIRQQIINTLKEIESIDLTIPNDTFYYNGGEWTIDLRTSLETDDFILSFNLKANGGYSCQYSIDEPDEYENTLNNIGVSDVELWIHDNEIELIESVVAWIKEYIVKNKIIINL